jgi:hypothetical protein
VVSGRDDHQQHEGRVSEPGEARERVRRVTGKAGADDQRVAAALAAAAAVEDELLAGLDGEQRAELRELLVLAAESSGLSEPCADPVMDAVADEQDDCA